MIKGRRCGWVAVAQVFETGHLEEGGGPESLFQLAHGPAFLCSSHSC